MLPTVSTVVSRGVAVAIETGPEGLVDYGPALTRAAWFTLGFAVVVAVGWFVVEPVVSRAIRHRNQNNPTIREAISRYLRLFVLIVGFFVGVGVAGYGGLIADSALVIAAATLAVGVAAQTVIGSLVSGIVLVADPEFNVGDYIEWEDGEGTVRTITLRITRVHTRDGGLVTIPNTVLTEQTIRRPYGQNRYQIIDRIDIAYHDDIDEAIRILEATASDLARVLDAPSPRAYVEQFGNDAVTIEIGYWVDDPHGQNLPAIRSRYSRSVKRELEAADITISPSSKHDLEGRIDVELGE